MCLNKCKIRIVKNITFLDFRVSDENTGKLHYQYSPIMLAVDCKHMIQDIKD